MIRRQPTLIELSEQDVQDVKAYIEKRKAEAAANANADPLNQLANAAAAALAAKVPTKEERLGLR